MGTHVHHTHVHTNTHTQGGEGGREGERERQRQTEIFFNFIGHALRNGVASAGGAALEVVQQCS